MVLRFIHHNFKKKILSPLDLWNLSYQNFVKHKSLNSLITFCEEESYKKANESSERFANDCDLGLFDGIPLVVKDNFCTKNIKTTCASKMLHNFIPPYTATVVEKVCNNGSLLIGKSNMDDFAMGSGTLASYYGPVRNPWTLKTSLKDCFDDFYIAGGSSGGSAASVASGLSVLAFGSDTGGSVIIPSALCGIVGLKPTYGSLSRHGLIALCNTFDVPGLMANSIEDCEFFFDLVSGPDVYDSTTIKRKIANNDLSKPFLKIGIAKEFHTPGMTSEVLLLWDTIAGWLSDMGHSVKTVSLPHVPYVIKLYSVLAYCDIASNMARYDGLEYGHRADSDYSTEALYAKSRHEGFNSVIRKRILIGNYFLLKNNVDKYYTKAQKIWRLLCNDYNQVFHSPDSVDILLAPVTAGDAPKYSDFIKKDYIAQSFRFDQCSQPNNLAGVPSLSIPITLSHNNLPLSLQLIGPKNSEKLLFEVGKSISERAQFPKFYDLESIISKGQLKD